jgi:hypothetical protein
MLPRTPDAETLLERTAITATTTATKIARLEDDEKTMGTTVDRYTHSHKV